MKGVGVRFRAPLWVLMVWAFVVCAGCSYVAGNGATGEVESTTPSQAPWGRPVSEIDFAAGESFDCSGLSEEMFEDLFGKPVETSSHTWRGQTPNSECYVKRAGLSKYPLYYSDFGFSAEDVTPDGRSGIGGGDTYSAFEIEGVEGTGEAWVDTGEEARYATVVFACGDRYMKAAFRRVGDINGDPREALISLVEASTPWLCGDEPIPGLDEPMESYRPPWVPATTPPSTDAEAN